jgi:hypothetical protein
VVVEADIDALGGWREMDNDTTLISVVFDGCRAPLPQSRTDAFSGTSLGTAQPPKSKSMSLDSPPLRSIDRDGSAPEAQK